MKNIRSLLLISLLLVSLAASAQNRKIAIDTTVVTNHTTTIEGQKISYTATTGTQPVWNEKGEPDATLFYTYYKRTDVNDKNRPLS